MTPPDRGLWISLGVFSLIVVLLVSQVLLPGLLRNEASSNQRHYPIGLAVPEATGNVTTGWTYAIRVSMTPDYAWPNLVLADLTIMLFDAAGGTRYTVPAGATLEVVSATGGPIAEYEFASQAWWIGYSAAVEDGQVLILRGMIPPGEPATRGSVGFLNGVTFSLVYWTGVSVSTELL